MGLTDHVPRPSLAAAGTAARRALTGVPRELARHRAPLVGRVAAFGPPDARRALARYGALAPSYDVRTAAGEPYRRQTVDRLAPAPAETIIDVGCGTGLNFALLEAGVGPAGRLIGIDPSTEMLAEAGARVRQRGWHNVTLVHAGAEDLRLEERADAALLCGVHDVMRSRAALVNILAHVREGGRIVAAGPRWARWTRPDGLAVNFSTWHMNRDFVTTFEGFDRPWSILAELLPGLQVEDAYFGAGYIASGRR